MHEMRVVPVFEKKQRGCVYCMEVQMTKSKGCRRCGCPHDVCPYEILDKYESYEQFMASEDSKILVDGFFQTTASCYDLANGNATVKDVFRRAYSGHDF